MAFKLKLAYARSSNNLYVKLESSSKLAYTQPAS